MSSTSDPMPTYPTPRTAAERLELANRLYREFRAQCFWHCPHDLVITEELLPFVVKGLRTYGGRCGFMLAGKLRRHPISQERDVLECH